MKNKQKFFARIGITLVLLFTAGVVFGAGPSATDLAKIEEIKKADYSVQGLKSLGSEEGWTEFEAKDGSSIYQREDGLIYWIRNDGWEVAREENGTLTLYAPDGRRYTWDAVAKNLTWTPSVGDAAPDFELAQLGSSAKVKLSGLRGSVVMLDFFASWCGPCMQSMPETQRMWTQYQAKGLKLYGLNVEGDTKKAQGVVSQLKLTFPVIMAQPGAEGGFNWESKQISDYGVEGIPHVVVIDKKGVIRYADTGLPSRSLIDALIAEK